MATLRKPCSILDEISDFLASSPSPEQIIAYRPSKRMQQRASRLLAKQNAGRLTEDEKRELDGFVHTEILMGLTKAKMRVQAAKST